jgi:hypothetical protein
VNIAISVNNHKIRMPNERWLHIMDEHPEMAELYQDILETITLPDFLYLGNQGELLAVRFFENKHKYIIVVYKETEFDDGFVITSFITSKIDYLFKRTLVWKKQ